MLRNFLDNHNSLLKAANEGKPEANARQSLIESIMQAMDGNLFTDPDERDLLRGIAYYWRMEEASSRFPKDSSSRRFRESEIPNLTRGQKPLPAWGRNWRR